MKTFTVTLMIAAATQALKMGMMASKECPAGYHYVNKNVGCDPCPVGHYCPVGTKKHAEPCPAGTYQDMLGASSAAECKLCPITKYAEHDGSFECYECPAGAYCGYEGLANPITCPVNYYCPAASAAPISCPGETHNDYAGADEESDCIYDEPIVCPAGSYAMGSNTCVDCVAGSYCEKLGLVEPTGLCPYDHYCPAGTAVPEMCPAGYYTEYEGSADITECIEDTACAEGMVWVEETSECQICPGGFYCDDSSIEPIWCPVGFYCPAGSIEPQSCPEGTGHSMVGSDGAEDCLGEDEWAAAEAADEEEVCFDDEGEVVDCPEEEAEEACFDDDDELVECPEEDDTEEDDGSAEDDDEVVEVEE